MKNNIIGARLIQLIPVWILAGCAGFFIIKKAGMDTLLVILGYTFLCILVVFIFVYLGYKFENKPNNSLRETIKSKSFKKEDIKNIGIGIGITHEGVFPIKYGPISKK